MLSSLGLVEEWRNKGVGVVVDKGGAVVDKGVGVVVDKGGVVVDKGVGVVVDKGEGRGRG